MAATAAATVLGCCAFTSSYSSTPRRRFSRRPTFPATTRTTRSSPVLASNPDRQGKISDENPKSSSSFQVLQNPKSSSSFQEDLNYTLQLGAGSVAGAALVKYGSVLFPDITRPNLVQALIMISAPVVVAIYLLVKQSRAD